MDDSDGSLFAGSALFTPSSGIKEECILVECDLCVHSLTRSNGEGFLEAPTSRISGIHDEDTPEVGNI